MEDKTQQASPQSQPPQPDAAALQAEIQGFRTLAGSLLGRELKADEDAQALMRQIQADRDTEARRNLEVRSAIAESLLVAGLQTPDLQYLHYQIQHNQALQPFAQKADWNGLLGKAQEIGLVIKPQAPAAQAPAVSLPPVVRPQQSSPAQEPDQFAHVKSKQDLRNLTATQLVALKKASPDKYRSLTQ